MVSDVCSECELKIKELFLCDGCKRGLCKTCGYLTSSEVKVLQLRERVMLFHCTKCKKFNTFMLLQNTIQDKSEIIANKDEIINSLKKKIHDMELYQKNLTPIPMSYSSVTKKSIEENKKLVINNAPSLVIKPKRKQKIEKTENDLRAKINPSEMEISIKSTRSTTNGNIIVKCHNRNDLETLKREADTKLSDYEVQILKLRKPRIKIAAYTGNLDEDGLVRSLRKQNHFIDMNDELQVTYIRRNTKTNSSIIFMDCSPTLFHKLMDARKVYIGWERCPVYEDIRITRCFKCQEHYHKADVCKNAVVCEYCALDHDVRDCPKTRQLCNNCVKANNLYKTKYSTDHTTNDSNCPSYQYLINVLRSKIDYGNQS